jgi:hypothetical protein
MGFDGGRPTKRALLDLEQSSARSFEPYGTDTVCDADAVPRPQGFTADTVNV